MTPQRARRASRTWTIAWLIAVVLLAPAMVVAATTPDGSVGWVAPLPPAIVLWLGLWKSIYYGGWADGHDTATQAGTCDDECPPITFAGQPTSPRHCNLPPGHRAWHTDGETRWRKSA